MSYNIPDYYTLRSQSLFRELQIILDILLCVERGRIAEGAILSCALRGRIARTERSTLYEREIENFGDAESTKRSAKE